VDLVHRIFRVVRRIALRASLAQSTPLAATTHTAHWAPESGVVENAWLSPPTCTTATWSSTETPIAAHSHRFTKSRRNALAVSERAFRQLNNWASTSTVKPAVRALSRVPGAPGASGTRPPGR